MNQDELKARTKQFGLRVMNLQLMSYGVPLPSLDIQRRIVAELEAERKLVEANREMIARMEAKILAKLAEVWGKEENMVLP